MLSGEHRFYVSQNGEPERPSGQARFAHVWRSGGAGWRMQRVLSYAHGPATYVPPQAAVVPAASLQRLAGRYRGQNVGDITVIADGAGLRLTAGPLALTLRPVSETEFFVNERDLRFRFSGDRLVVIENGAEVESASRLDEPQAAARR